MIGVLVLSAFVAYASGRPSDSVVPQNVVTVPPNCPAGQEWVNGQCRDVWRYLDASVSNVITVPPNCPAGQEYVNGQCRDVWFKSQKEIYMLKISSYDTSDNIISPVQVVELSDRNVISVPNQCPIGYKPDALGVCREIFRNIE